MNPKSKEERLRPLAEGEIRHRLYGASQAGATAGRSGEGAPVSAEAAQSLLQELEQLKQDVQALRGRLGSELDDKAQLEKRWQRLKRFSQANRGWRRRYRPVLLRRYRIAILAVIALLCVVPLALVGTFWVRSMMVGRVIPSAATPSAPARPYTVQVATVERREAAEELASRLRKRGFEATVDAYLSAKGRTFYRVFVGAFATLSESQGMLNRMRTDEGFKDSFIRRRTSS